MAVRPEGAITKPVEPESEQSLSEAARLPGVGAVDGVAAGVPAGAAGAGKGRASWRTINLRFNSVKRGH